MERVGCRGPQPGEPCVQRGNLMWREMRRDGLAERGRFFPRHDRRMRRDPDDPQRNLDA